MLKIMGHTLRVDRRGLLAWTTGLVLTILLYLVFYPSIADNAEAFRKAIETLPATLRAFAGGQSDPVAPAGYLQGKYFGMLAVILLFSFAIGRGARAIAGEEEEGTLELVLAAPVSRSRVLVERALALLVELVVISLASWLTLVVLGPVFRVNVPVSQITAAVVSLALGSYVFGSLALAAGAASGRRAVAIGVGAAAASAAYLFTTLAPLTPVLTDRRALSPAWQSFGTRPVETGFHVADLAILAAEAIVLLLAGALLFARRDVR